MYNVLLYKSLCLLLYLLFPFIKLKPAVSVWAILLVGPMLLTDATATVTNHEWLNVFITKFVKVNLFNATPVGTCVIVFNMQYGRKNIIF